MAEWYAEKIIQGKGPLGKPITFSQVCVKIKNKYNATEANKLILGIRTILLNGGYDRLLKK